jgi:uncharacterized protein (UPF0332 family)
MDPLEFLQVADQLRQAPGDGARRTSVSRAYYALFNLAKVRLESAGMPTLPRLDAHQRFVERLTRCGDPTADDIGQLMHALRDDRNEADYDMSSVRFSANNCNLIYMQASRCIGELEALNREERRRIADSIRRFLAQPRA